MNVKVLRNLQCYTSKFRDIGQYIVNCAGNEAEYHAHVKIPWLQLDVRFKDEVTKEAQLIRHLYDEADNAGTHEAVENAKKYSLAFLLRRAKERGVNALDLAGLRKCDVMIGESKYDYFRKVTFAEAAFTYETMFGEVNASLYSKDLVKRLAGKELNIVELECKRAFLDEKRKFNDAKCSERIDVNNWYYAELKKLNLMVSAKKKAVRHECSEALNAFKKSLAV